MLHEGEVLNFPKWKITQREFIPSVFFFSCVSQAVCLREGKQEVLGIHFLGPNAGEVIQGFSAAMRYIYAS